MAKYRQKFARRKQLDAKRTSWFQMAKVVADESFSPGFYSELHKSFVIRIVKHGNPRIGSRVPFRKRAERVQQPADLSETR